MGRPDIVVAMSGDPTPPERHGARSYTESMLNRWTRWVLRHRSLLATAWVVLIIAGLLASSALDSRLSTTLNVPGSGSAQANAVLAAHFHQNIEGSFTVVVPNDHQGTGDIEHRVAAAVAAIPTGTVLQAKPLGTTLYVEVDTDLNLVRAAKVTAQFRAALARQGLERALVTGPAALQSDITPVLVSDLHHGEALALLLAFLLLVLVLGLCAAISVPFVVALATISTSLLLVYFLSHVVLMVLYVPNVIALIGLGLAIDYSLLIVHRFRAESAVAHSTTEAVVATMERAGHTVAVSGIAVTVGLATLLLIPVPFLRSLGAAGIVVPLVSIAAALTLQPVLLSWLGTTGLRSFGLRGLMGERDRLSQWWSRLTGGVLAHAPQVLLASLVVLVGLAANAWWLQLTPGSLTALPSELASTRADAFMSRHVGPGVMTPDQVVLVAPAGQSWRSKSWQAVEMRLGTLVLQENEVRDVAIGIKAPYMDASGRYTQMLVIGGHQFGAAQSQALVDRIRDVDVPAAHLPRGVQVYVGGAPAQGVDYLSRAYGAFPWVIALAMASALVILWRAFRSRTLAILAVVLDLVSVAAAYGVMVAVVRFHALGSWWHGYQVSQIEGWVPVFIFAMLFGLSMDYEVFIVERMREARENGLGTNDAIVAGLANTGGVVSAAALIMVGAVSGMAFGRVAGLQELGVGLAAGVLLDATVVRGLLLPASLSLLGDRSWR